MFMLHCKQAKLRVGHLKLIRFLFVTSFDSAATTDGCKANYTFRLIQDVQDLAAKVEWPNLPLEVESAQCLVVKILSM